MIPTPVQGTQVEDLTLQAGWPPPEEEASKDGNGEAQRVGLK